MALDHESRTGGHILVDQLLVHGARMAFCVPGESFLEVLDGLHDAEPRIRLINARHEAGAANMAEAYGKLTGQPGICLVTRGPGACQASVGVHTAFQDSTPMILLVGQVPRDHVDREAFQEVDYRQMFAPLAKWVAQIDVTARIPEYIARAFHIATSGRPGPVVLALPEDMLTEHASVADAKPFNRVAPAFALQQASEVRTLLQTARRPLMLVGGSGWSEDACRDIIAFAEANGLPTACSFRRQDLFDNRSDCFVGDFGTSGPPALIRRVQEADLLLVVGARLGEMTTQGYSLLEGAQLARVLIHVHASAEELGRVFRPDVSIVAAPAAFAAGMAAQPALDPAPWRDWARAAREDFLAATAAPPPGDWPLNLARVLTEYREILPKDAIVTLDAGNHTGWPQRFLYYGRPGRQLGPTSGAMGYSVPAAVAASLIHPDRLVLGCVGDGGFMMSGQEIATAIQHGGKPIILVFNNQMYGTIRMHQEREHPNRVVGTNLVNPDFVALGLAMGAHAELVTCDEEFAPALARAASSGKAALIELRTDPELISTRMTITRLRQAALAR
jgi:acetolactate synthase-1/2/3 large subunit